MNPTATDFSNSEKVQQVSQEIAFGRIPEWKRVLDCTLVILAAPIWLPITILMAVWVKLVSPGPMLFRQERIGHMGAKFLILKLRTMKVNADTTVHREHLTKLMASKQPMRKLDSTGDSRLIPGGLWLRTLGLDELPQLINVLRGEMSLVGPRPTTAYEFEMFDPHYRQRCRTLPGLTGLWQVNGKNRTTFERMMELDLAYVEKKSLWMDLRILAATIPAILIQLWDVKIARRGKAQMPSPTVSPIPRPAANGYRGSMIVNTNKATTRLPILAAPAPGVPAFKRPRNRWTVDPTQQDTETPIMSKPINVGVVGCGYWGPNLVRNFRSLKECRLKMICDISQARLSHLQELYPGVEAETDYEKMLKTGGLDAVVVATSVKFHYPMAKAALEAGKHVMIEKPMAASAAHCEELIAIADAKGLVLMVGHTFLYSPAVRKIKELVDRGDVGEVLYICARRLNLGLFQKDINVAWDLAPHDISIILHLLGDMPESVNCRGSAHVTPGIEDVTAMSLIFSKNRSAIIHSSWLGPRKVREMTIVGSKRMIVYDDVALQEKIRIFDARVERPPHYDTFAEFHYAYHYGDTYAPYLKQEEPLKTECQHFLDCVRDSKTPLSCGRRGLELVRILEASSASLRLGGGAVAFAPQETKNGSPIAAAPHGRQPARVGAASAAA